jgi:hypothetical protein
LAGQRLDTKQAASILGITPDAVRKRASRGQLESEKGADDKLYIWLDTDTPPPGQDDRDRLIEFLRHELDVWQEEARRKDHIIAALAGRRALLVAEVLRALGGGAGGTHFGGAGARGGAPLTT